MSSKIRVVNEKNLEKHFQAEITRRGGLTFKFTSPQNSGVFDRIAILPNGQVWFVEFKSPGKTLTSLQQVFQKRVDACNGKTWVIDGLEQFNKFFNTIDHDL